VIYLETSVLLAHLFAEDHAPRPGLWDESLVTSRLLEYEAWTVLHARGVGRSHGESLRALLARLAFLELDAPVLARALEPFPAPVRTLDALHLASIEFLRAHGQKVELASYDERLRAAAAKLKVPLAKV
jgi:predicted nucleic acid-binding protein